MMKHRIIPLFLSTILLLVSCGKKDPHNFKKLPPGPIKHQLIVVAQTPQGIKVRGFKGSTPKGTKIFFKVGLHETTVTSDNNGSFSFEIAEKNPPARADELSFVTSSGQTLQTSYFIKNLASSLANIAGEPIEPPKDLQSIGFINKKIALLSGTAAVVSVFEGKNDWTLPDEPLVTISLHPGNPDNLGAQMIDGIDRFALVPLFNTSEIALLDLETNRLVSKNRLKNTSGKLYTFDLTPPLTLNHPIDADGSGATTSTISRSFAHNPQSVLALDATHFLVSFANYYQVAKKNDSSVLGPGIIALLAIDGESISTKQIIHLPFLNPQYLVKTKDGSVWVSCSGAWIFDPTSPQPKTRGAGLVKLTVATDKNSVQMAHQLDLKDFAPARPVILANKIVVPRSWNNEIAIFDEKATSLDAAQIKTPIFDRKFNFTFANLWHDDIIMLGDAQGALVAYSLNEGWFPFPFVEPIKLNKLQDEKINLNPQALYFRHHINGEDLSADYIPGYSAWVEVPGQQKIIPLDFNELFGP